MITPEPNRSKGRVRLPLGQCMTNNRPEQGSFEDVVSRQSPAGYDDRVVQMGKPVKATAEILQALRRFCRKPSSNCRHGLSFFLADQLYTADISASHPAHIFLSRKYLVADRETFWVLASFNILKECGTLRGEVAERLEKLWIVKLETIGQCLLHGAPRGSKSK